MTVRTVVGCGLVLLWGVISAFGQADAAKKNYPHWIWLTKNNAKETIFLRHTFELPEGVKSAKLGIAADDSAKLFLNGEPALEHTGWKEAGGADVTKFVRHGKNVIAAECSNNDGPGAVILHLSIELADGKKRTIMTNEHWVGSPTAGDGWKTVDFNASDWKRVVSLGEWGVSPWGEIVLSEDAPQPQATTEKDIETLPGFKIERLYSVPKITQGSWVSMTADPKGRLIVSDQYGGLFRITPGKSEADTRVEKLAVDIGESQGMLYAFDSLYVVVNGKAAQGSGLYRVRDTNGDDQFDSVELLKSIAGGGEHGPHAVRLGPDGKLYVIAGNFTKPPAGYDSMSPCRHWSEDHVLKRNPDGNGHATGLLAPGGWVCRTDKDGKEWTLMTTGFRNPYDMDFNLDGELFAFDADMEYDTGSPWYRPTRVNHCVSGGEFGWRFGTGKWPAYYVDSLGSVVDIGLGSPTGISFGTNAKFPEKYQRALFLCDWTYGKLYAVHMKPQGCTYTADFELFVSGKPFPLTDVVINRDGAMYLTIGGRKTQSGLYRVTYTGNESTAPVKPLVNPAAEQARATRKKLEALHQGIHPEAVDIAWPHLNSTDRYLRFAARIAIENQGIDGWREKALAETHVNAQIQALLLLTRVGTTRDQAAVLQRLNQLPFAQLTEEQFVDALRVYELAFVRLGGKQNHEQVQKVIETLNPLLPHSSEWVNRELCAVLIYLEAPGILDKALALLDQGSTQQDQMFYAFSLRTLKPGWTLEQRRIFFSWLNRAEQKYLGGASFVKFLDQARKDAQENMTPEEIASLKDVIEEKRSVESVKLTITRQYVHNWQVTDFPGVIAAASKGRNFAQGKAAYEATQCVKCHRFKGTGGDTGPDITGVGNRFDALYILESFVVPSKVVSDQYQNQVIHTHDGKVITGRVIKNEDDVLTVRTDPFARELTVVRKSDIDHQEPSTISEMPQGLINVLTKEEVLDLIAYLRAAGDEKDKAFQP